MLRWPDEVCSKCHIPLICGTHGLRCSLPVSCLGDLLMMTVRVSLPFLSEDVCFITLSTPALGGCTLHDDSFGEFLVVM